MTIQLDSITYKKLVVAKQIYQHAINQAEVQHSVTNRILAVIGFDLTVETVLGAVWAVLSPLQTDRPYGFPQLLKKCAVLLKALEITLPFEQYVNEAHNTRNQVQHHAYVPNDTDVNDSRIHTQAFCETLIEDLWDISFDTLSLVELIDDEKLKTLLNKATIHIDDQDYVKAVTLADSAFYWARRAIWSFLPTRNHGEVRIKNDVIDTLIAKAKDLDEEFLHLSNMISTGVTLDNYRRYTERTIQAHFFKNDTTASLKNSGNPYEIRAQVDCTNQFPSQDDALWIHGFAVNSILDWQTQDLNPKVPSEQIEYADVLLAWDDRVNAYRLPESEWWS